MRKKIVLAGIVTLVVMAGIFSIKAVSGEHTEQKVEEVTVARAEPLSIEWKTLVDINEPIKVAAALDDKKEKDTDYIIPKKYKELSIISIPKEKKNTEDESDEMVEIFKKKSDKSDVVGIGVKGSFVKVIETDKEWYKIKSGKITGYIRKEYVVTDMKAQKVLMDSKNLIVKIKSKTTELKGDNNKKAKVISNLQKGLEYPIIEVDRKWIKIERTLTVSGWVNVKDVEIDIHKEYLYTPEEYDDMIEQEWAKNAITYTLEETDLPKEGEAAEFLEYATQFLGNRYVWGGTSLKSGADCSGFVQAVFGNFGYSLSRTAAEQAHNGKAVKNNKLKPGDLVFYHTDKKNKDRISHVAIYIGNGKILHSANKTQGVVISKLGNPCAARRILNGKSLRQKSDVALNEKNTEETSKIQQPTTVNEITTTTAKVNNNVDNKSDDKVVETTIKKNDDNIVETTKEQVQTEKSTTKAEKEENETK